MIFTNEDLYVTNITNYSFYTHSNKLINENAVVKFFDRDESFVDRRVLVDGKIYIVTFATFFYMILKENSIREREFILWKKDMLI